MDLTKETVPKQLPASIPENSSKPIWDQLLGAGGGTVRLIHLGTEDYFVHDIVSVETNDVKQTKF